MKLGKVSPDFLNRLLSILPPIGEEVKVLPEPGADACVVEIEEGYWVLSSDPITFTEKDIGYYGVVVNANDIAVCGAVPKYFLFTLLLPHNVVEKQIETVFSEVSSLCKEYQITVVGGHTERTPELNKMLLSGTMIGFREKEKGYLPKEEKPSLLVCIKGVPIEGISIIAKEKEKNLLEEFGKEQVEKWKNFNKKPGISIVREALQIADIDGVVAMHDPTEGGLLNGIWEMAKFLEKGLMVYEDKLPVLPEGKILCEKFGIDPLKTIASGCLLVACKTDTVDKIKDKSLPVSIIGEFKEKEFGVKMRKGNKIISISPCQDDITNLL